MTTMACPEQAVKSITLSSKSIAPRERYDWLHEVICKEYTPIDIISPAQTDLSQQLIIYPWGDYLQLSTIQSSAISLQRKARQSQGNCQDTYLLVMLLSGDYVVEQHGRNAVLQAGDLVLYDATQPHRLHCQGASTEVIYLSIPRAVLRERVTGIDCCTALRLSGQQGIGSVAGNFLRTCATHAPQLTAHEFSALSDQALDMLTLALTSVRPVNINLSRSRTASLNHIKAFIEQMLGESELNTRTVARYSGLSVRYINTLFENEGLSLMRYVWKRRLEQCQKDLLKPCYSNHHITALAFRWGFNDAAHFSRAFKQQFGHSPREFRNLHATRLIG